MRERVPPLLAALLSATLLACASARAPGGGVEAGAAVAFETVVVSPFGCRAGEKDETWLGDADAWAAWWEHATCGRLGPAPAVDFRSRVVIAIRGPLGPSSCYGSGIHEIRSTADGGYRVVVVRRVPLRGQACSAVVNEPIHAVSVPRPRGGVTFEWRTVQGSPVR